MFPNQSVYPSSTDDDYSDTYSATYAFINSADDHSLSSSITMAHPPPRTHTYKPLSKSPSDNGGQLGTREPSPSPVPPPPPPMASLLQLRARDSDREKDSPDTNEWGPPDRKVDTRKYRAEPKSIFEYEPGKSSILEHERPTSLHVAPADKALERPASAASDYRKRRKSEPSSSQVNAQFQSRAATSPKPVEAYRSSSSLKKPVIRSSPSSPSRAKGGDACNIYLNNMSTPGSYESTSLPPIPSDSDRIHEDANEEGSSSSKQSVFCSNSWPTKSQDAEAWSSAEEVSPSSGKIKSRSCDDLLNDGHSGTGGQNATRSESVGSLMCDGNPSTVSPSTQSLPRPHRRRAHDSPGFLQLYRRMHQIDRAHLIPSDVIRSVRARILELERQPHLHRHRLSPWTPSWGVDVPRDIVPNRISEYERLIQKSKSMPNLGDGEVPSGTTTPGGSSSRASSAGGGTASFPKRRFSIESLLEEDNNGNTRTVPKNMDHITRSPPEGQPRVGPETARGQSFPAPPVPQCPQANPDYSDSEQDAIASDLSDFIQVEGSSFCSESDFDHCSLTSSESLYGSSTLHHHHLRHHHHHHHHHNNHPHHHGNSTDLHVQVIKSTKSPENENSAAGIRTENLDVQVSPHGAKPSVASAQVVGTTEEYGTQLVVKPEGRRSARLSRSSEETVTITDAATESLTAAVSRDDHDEADDQDHLQNRSLNRIECLNASSLLASHGMSQEVGVALRDFSYLCPALLNQIDRGACIVHGDSSSRLQESSRNVGKRLGADSEHKHHEHAHGHHGDRNHSVNSLSELGDGGGENSRNISTAWLGGFLSITIISLLSLLGVILIPLMNRVFFKFLLSFLVALAVGTLSGDAFLHLIPHSQGSHHHQHPEGFEMSVEEPHLHDEGEENMDAVWKGLTALSGVYFMFLIEHFLTLGKMYKDKKQKVHKKWDQNDKQEPGKQPALEDLKPMEDVETNGTSTFGDHSSSMAEEEQVMLAPQVSIVSPQDYGRPSSADAYTAEDCENKCHSHFHDTVGQADSMHHHHHDYHHILHHHHSQNHHPHSHSHSYSEQHFQQAGVATLAWMVIMGDGLHNFSDGLAIGAAFTEGLSSGLSTSVAVFCHELPHELGDFAVLLKAGMTVRQAILYNVLSAMMAYLGMVTGIVIGHYAENICMWIFALTAGLFMYVALVDMVPEMLHNDAGDHGFSHWGFFFLQNAGILLGFCIMLLIALFEHKIQLDLEF
uniref:Zinc transporter ZIP6 n=1 Tax=Nothobranchius kuhntae TaxID=321403 RepID=A0A1A8J4X2_NOTKU